MLPCVRWRGCGRGCGHGYRGGVSYHVHVGVGAGMGAAAVYLTFPNFSKSENPPNRSKPCPSVPTPGAERSRDYGLPAPSGRARTEGCTDGLTCKPGAYPARALERAAVPRPYPNLSSGNGPYRRESPEPPQNRKAFYYLNFRTFRGSPFAGGRDIWAGRGRGRCIGNRAIEGQQSAAGARGRDDMTKALRCVIFMAVP